MLGDGASWVVSTSISVFAITSVVVGSGGESGRHIVRPSNLSTANRTVPVLDLFASIRTTFQGI